MKKTFLLLAILCCCTKTFSQPPQWTWVAGSNLAGQPGSFGAKGVPSPNNNPVCRYIAASWTGKDGTLWLFGGAGDFSNDLWNFNPNTGLWTWISGENTITAAGTYGPPGQPSINYSPQGRQSAAYWTDKQGNLWLFGGSINDNQDALSDLWKFNPSTLEWTLVAGNDLTGQPGIYGAKGVPSTANLPPGLERMTSFTDHNGMFWLYGGTGKDGVDDDLWKFNPTTLEWTWVNGNHTIARYPNFPAVYGTKGVPSAANTPGPRIDAGGWVDNNNNLWLFGAAAGWDFLNDLWKYDPLTDQWTWVSGDNTFFSAGIYGTKGIPAPANKPSCRYGATTFPTTDGKLWLFGGLGMGADPDPSHADELNDLWCYDIAAGQWTWMAGENTIDPLGVYGTKGVGAPGNEPGGRIWASGWTDNYGRLWLFGGGGYASQPRIDETNNDLWGYFPPLNITITAVSATALCTGAGLDLTFTTMGVFPAANTFTAQLSDATGSFANPVDIGTLSATTGATITAAIPAATPSGNGYRVRIVSPATGTASPDNGSDILIYGKPVLTITPTTNTTDICPGTSIGLTAGATGGNPPYQYQWSTGEASASITFTPPADTTLQVTVIDGCTVAAAIDSIRMTLYRRDFQLTGNPVLCPNAAETLNAHTGYAAWLWQDGSTDSTLTITRPGTYTVNVTDQCGKAFNGAITVAPDNVPTGFLPPDTAICSYSDLPIVPAGIYKGYQWSTGETTHSITVSDPGLYWLKVIDNAGCPALDTIIVANKACFIGFRMPSAFTPDGDGHNDLLKPLLFGRILRMHFTVYNRYGGKVFETTDPAKGWDGNAPSGGKVMGACVWTCEYQFEGQSLQWAKGTVIVIR